MYHYSLASVSFLTGLISLLIPATAMALSVPMVRVNPLSLKILSGDLDTTSGTISVAGGKRISVLKQDQFAFDEITVLMTVVMGHKELYKVMKEKDELYSKPDFSDADGLARF
jgi:hypothetical protein